MEDVLDFYAEPYDARRPQVCFDESPVQLISETRQPLPARPGQPARYDYEYRRRRHSESLSLRPAVVWLAACQRHSSAHQVDFASLMQELVDVHFPDADAIILVVDNLNTHTPAALYETFPPAEARRIWEVGVSLYAQAWQLAQYGRVCICRAHRAVFGSPPARHRDPHAEKSPPGKPRAIATKRRSTGALVRLMPA